IVAAAPFIRGEGMLRSGDRLSGTLIRGVLPEMEAQVSTVGEHMRFGSLDALEPGRYHMVMGQELARSLGLSPGDKVDLMIPQASVTPAGILPRFRRFTLAAVFEVGMYEYDRGLVLIHLQDAAALYRMGDAVTGLRLRLADLFQAPRISRLLMVNLDEQYYISDWTRQHANFFRAIRTEKTVMFIILSLIVAVAAFNIVSTLVMVVTDKQADIAILRTQGAAPGSILSIFMVQGALIGIIGTLLGVIGGVLLAVNVESIVPWVESLVGQDLLSAEVYYINELKGEVHADDVLLIGFVSLLLSFFSTLYPAWRAAKVQPAEALRYE
ncbi:MAG: lipoprotein-releasing ABC transporter permease subunit, partial [Nevskiales bacterium]